MRRWNDADVLVVDCTNHGIPTKASRGIQHVERLALVFWEDRQCMPEVRALRRDFPAIEHQNSVRNGEPASLCLYFEPWPTVARTWTAHKHFRRIITWLTDVAAGVLHRADQPVEHFYFATPWEIVLPPDLIRAEGVPADQILLMTRSLAGPDGKSLIRVRLAQRDTCAGTPQQFSTLLISVPPVVSGIVERPPTTLGQLAEHLVRRGSTLIPALVDAINAVAEGHGLASAPSEGGLLIMCLPIQRQAGGDVERIDVQGFLLEKGLAALGTALGLLSLGKDGIHYRAVVLGEDPYAVPDAWKATTIAPVAVLHDLTPARARQLTGVNPATAEFSGVLVGAGSLGSALADIWGREAWGTWPLVDDDLLRPHNVPRHRAVYDQVGLPKVVAIDQLRSAFFPTGALLTRSIAKNALTADADVSDALKEAVLIVDASTTLYVPREFAGRPELPRVASAFLTPSGKAAVLLLEDQKRSIRVDALEAQYYRAILRSDWGVQHLAGNLASELWIGAGCREVTTVLAPDMVSIHAGTLARQLRIRRDLDAATIGVWEHDDATGGTSAHIIEPAPAMTRSAGEWRVCWDDTLVQTVRAYRRQGLPAETGGILLGYIDQTSKTIYLVDALPAPDDSVEDSGSFERGKDGLSAAVDLVSQLTAEVVGYIGEWHSHPDGCSTNPSGMDITQLIFLAKHLRQDGHPAFMMIVGEHDETLLIGDVED
ncbi:MAG: Mov34/MPN/PAD-1 family protein [Sulfuricaulis sp.]